MVYPGFHSLTQGTAYISYSVLNFNRPNLKSHATLKPYSSPKATMLSMISADVLAQGQVD